MWLAKATYDDGTEVEWYFRRNKKYTEADDQYNIEDKLLNFHDSCNWYSVVWVEEDEI